MDLFKGAARARPFHRAHLESPSSSSLGKISPSPENELPLASHQCRVASALDSKVHTATLGLQESIEHGGKVSSELLAASQG